MSNMFDDATEIVKKEMVLFFVIDTSGSMAGTKIGAVNTAIREVIPELRGIGGSDAVIKIAVLLFSTAVQWMYKEPVSVDDFQWNTIEAGGVTALGAACEELNDKMSRNTFLKAASASVAPAIFLMSDGDPTDDYKHGLAKLKNNRWFKNAIRVAVGIGTEDDVSTENLADFAGSSEAVIYTPTAVELRKMIRFVSITSSQIGSVSQPISESGNIETKQENMIQAIQGLQADSSGAAVDDSWD